VRHCPRERQPWLLSSVIAPLRYEYPLSVEIQALKFSRRRSYGRALGLILEEHLRGRPEVTDIDAIIAVPLHRRRLCERGYNQALEIARPVAARLKLPVLISGVSRSTATLPQADLYPRERRSNVANVFSVSRNMRGRRIAIVDDVITTGATVNALASKVLAAGATEVHAWAVSRTL
jgi:ComF family protein